MGSRKHPFYVIILGAKACHPEPVEGRAQRPYPLCFDRLSMTPVVISPQPLNPEIENLNSEIKTMAFPLANGPVRQLADPNPRLGMAGPVRAVGFPLQSLTRPGLGAESEGEYSCQPCLPFSSACGPQGTTLRQRF